MTLKATQNETVSDGIVVSFHAKWQPLLDSRAVNCVFRKRGPRHITTNWIYVYVSTPTKAIVGRLPVKKVEVLSVRECMGYATAGAITQDELSKSATGYKELFAFTVGNFKPANRVAGLNQLRSRHGFTPPQSFLLLSKQGKRQLDKLLDF